LVLVKTPTLGTTLSDSSGDRGERPIFVGLNPTKFLVIQNESKTQMIFGIFTPSFSSKTIFKSPILGQERSTEKGLMHCLDWSLDHETRQQTSGNWAWVSRFP
jgi:hypothetical protein